MSSKNGSEYESLIQKAVDEIQFNDYESAILTAKSAFSIAEDEENLPDQIQAAFIIGGAFEALGRYEDALVKFSWVIAQAENNSSTIGLSNTRISGSVLYSFGHWTHCAIKLPNSFNEEAIEIIKAAENFANSNGLMNWKPELLHAKSVALMGLKLFQKALITAEEALALKKLDPYSPGCGLDHHLEIYSSILKELDREKDAITVLDQAIDKSPWESGLWASRGWLNYRLFNFKSAVKDLNEAIFLDDKIDVFYYLLKGVSEVLTNHKQQACETFRHTFIRSPSYIYPTLWLAAIKKDFSLLPELKEDKSIYHVVDFYRKRVTEEDIIKIAISKTSEPTQKKMLCEIYAYLGLYYEQIDNSPNKAKDYYQMSIETESIRDLEYTWSSIRLQQLNL